MKFSEAWLREWLSPGLAREELCERLTMTGLEVEAVTPAAESFIKVVIGKLRALKAHPETQELQLCEVEVGKGLPLSIVCAARNLHVGMKVAVALVAAVLPKQVVVKERQVRGVHSSGMLCSAADLGLAEESEGLLELPSEAPLGMELWEYLQLNDHIIEVAVTPNRGDCLSLAGMAREVAAVTGTRLKKPAIPAVKPLIPDFFPVTIRAKEACPHYVGRVIRGLNAKASTPIWLKERLRRSGLRSISPIVDVTNYVMLELGQPMHAFDLARLEKKLIVRMASKDETLLLLDGRQVQLNEKTLIIADQKKPLALAGLMGGADSGISEASQDIFLESAFFTPTIVARQRQLYQLNSESAYRFERGVDPNLQRGALERASRLLIDIAGGKPGPIIEEKARQYLPSKKLSLRAARIPSLLGNSSITATKVKSLLQRLGFECQKKKKQWQLKVPTWRFDVSQEVDLIEELARLDGYDKISPTRPQFPIQSHQLSENRLALPRVRRLFSDLGYHEVMTYSFVSADLQSLVDPERKPKVLVNPLSSDMGVMRTSLWPGLLGTYLYNRDRQQAGGRFFELGFCFIEQQKQLAQLSLLGGLISGTAFPSQWGLHSRECDFFDLKGDLEHLFQLTHIPQDQFYFKTSTHPALHPGQTAALYREKQLLGIMGALHPSIRQKFDISEPIFLFECNIDPLLQARFPYFTEISKFPEIRRDLALLVDRHIPTQEIRATIINNGGEWLRQVNVFDVYLGEGIPANKKSVAFALILQHATRTLRDEEVAETMDRVIGVLRQTFDIELRG